MSVTTVITLRYEFPGSIIDNAENIAALRPQLSTSTEHKVKEVKPGGAKRGRKPKVVAEAAD